MDPRRMDPRLISWAWAARRRFGRFPPPLWLFTDSRRLPDPRPAAGRLPRGLAGIVLRHDADPDREVLARDLARICRARRLVLVVAGDPGLAARVGAGLHLRRGAAAGPGRRRGVLRTSSVHDFKELRRARRAGAALAFLSPAFPTASHPGATALGAIRWTALARRAGLPVAALGGMDGRTVRRLPPLLCRGIGAIGALA